MSRFSKTSRIQDSERLIFDTHLLKKFVITNKEIIRLKELAFQIKLKSLNEQILSIRYDMKESGFQVVSKELINFSNLFEDIAHKMLEIMAKMLPLISGQLKQLKYTKIKKRTLLLIRDNHSRNLLERTLENYKLNEKFKEQQNLWRELMIIIKKTEILSLQGNVIFLQSKITSAYVKNSLSLNELNVLTEELGNDISEIRNCVNIIKNIWENN